jgi:hypothetical protein
LADTLLFPYLPYGLSRQDVERIACFGGFVQLLLTIPQRSRKGACCQHRW